MASIRTLRMDASACQKALLQGVPAPAGTGIKLEHVISGGVYLGNDTSYARWADFPARDRDPACVLAFSKKRLCRFFDSLAAPERCPGAALCLIYLASGHISRYMTAFWAWRRFSASSKISWAWASKTSAVISSPRWAGRQCCTIHPGLVRVIRRSLT